MGQLHDEDAERPSSPAPPAFVGLVLLALATAALLVSDELAVRGARTVGQVFAVNSSAHSKLDVTGHNSPRLVADPTDPNNLAVASRVDTPRFSCGLHVSNDGGSTWREAQVPLPASDPVRCFAPDVAFSADGTLHLAFTSFATVEGHGVVPEAVWLSSSADKGATMSDPARVSGPLAFQVRLAADPADRLRLYLVWLQASQVAAFGLADVGSPIVLARSEDGGRTWGEPVRVSSAARQRVVAPSLAVGGRGDIFVSYLDVGEDKLDYSGAHRGMGGEPYAGSWSLVVARSDDGGVTWSGATVDRTLVPVNRFVQLFPPTPSLVATRDREPRLYVGFHDARSGDPDVWVWASDDGARTWGRPRRVNDTPARDGSSQYLPHLAVSPGGRLDVVYYDRRADKKDLMNEVSLQSSYDGGRSFSRRVRLSDRSFDSRIGFGSDRELPDLGDRHGLLSTDRRALAIWSDTRQGTQATGKQDLARVLVEFKPGSPLRRPLRWAALAAGLAATAAFISAVRRWRRRPLGSQEPSPASVRNR